MSVMSIILGKKKYIYRQILGDFKHCIAMPRNNAAIERIFSIKNIFYGQMKNIAFLSKQL